MSRTTPRKTRHRHHPSSGGPYAVAASDYESDAAHYMESRELPPPAQLPHRTNTDLNLSVLRRHLPSIRTIISIAANAVVYTFSPASQSWDKTGVEGTLFVCEQEPTVVAGRAVLRACVFILSRRGLENVVVDLASTSVCEASDELIMFNVVKPRGNEGGASIGQDGATGDTQVIGLWIHADQDDTREVNIAVIQEAWRRVQESAQETAEAPAQTEPAELAAQTEPTTGRRLSITDLFGQRNGNLP